MATSETISATEFKAKCLDILDRVSRHEIERLTITKRGTAVAVIVPPRPTVDQDDDLYGCMRGSVIIPPGADLTEPVIDEPSDAELGILHR
jgi:prevent-host-death family protein